MSYTVATVSASRMRPRRKRMLPAFLAVAAVLSVLGLLTATPVLSDWFTAGPRLDWSPGIGVFVCGWTVVYVADALAVWRVWDRRATVRDRRGALLLWGIQAGLHAGWILAFMAQSAVSGALLWGVFAVILVLDCVTMLAAWAAWPLSRAASLLQWATLGWVLFGTVLSFGDTIIRGSLP